MHSSVVLNRLLGKLRMRHLQAVLKLAELGNVNRAAQALHMTQPAVTLILADLERLIDAPLFVRHARGVTPTALARDLIPLLQQMLDRLQEGAETVASHLEHDEGMVRAAATAAAANGLLADVLPAFGAAHPQVQVLVNEVDPGALPATVASGLADLIFCRQPPVVPQGWRFTACVEDRFVFVCGPRHPLARRRRIALRDLAQARWLPNMVATAARSRFEALVQEHGWQPQTCQVVTRISTLTWALLDAQPLVTLVPLSVVQPWVRSRHLVVLPVRESLPFDPIGVLLPETGLGAACDKLVRFAQDTGRG